MTKKHIKSEFPNEVDILRTTLAEVKTQLPGLDTFLLENPECTRCSNSKDYQCIQLKGKPGCRTCTSRRISCTRHIQYLVEMAASRLEWSVEKTKCMYDKHVKQTRSGRKSPSKVTKKMPSRKAIDAPQTVGLGGTTDQTSAGGKGGRRNVAAPGDDDYEGNGGRYYQYGARKPPEDLENFSDDPDEDDDQDIEWNENTANNTTTPHSISNATKPHVLPLDDQEEIPAFINPVLDPEGPASDLGLHDSTSLRTDFEKTDTAQRVDDLIRPVQKEDGTGVRAPGAQCEDTPESNVSAEHCIKQLEEKVAKLNALRVVDAASISRLTKKADTAFDNMLVLLRRVHMHRQELETHVTKHIETVHQQQPFKTLIDKMDETSVSATQILMLLDKRKNYVVRNTTRVPVVITDEEGREWVPWDVISDDNDLRDDGETEKKRRRDNGLNGAGEGSSKRRKC